MSCDGNRATYFAAVSGAGSAADQAFGGEAAAKQTLDDLFDMGRNGPKPPADAKLAEAQTRLLFAGMIRLKIKPPTHSANGLPKTDAQYGYALIQRTLTALEKGEPLPPQARDLFIARERERQITGLRADVRGRIRCRGDRAGWRWGSLHPAAIEHHQHRTRRCHHLPGLLSPQLRHKAAAHRQRQAVEGYAHHFTGRRVPHHHIAGACRVE